MKKHLLTFGYERLEQSGKTYNVNGEKIISRKKTNNKWFETQDSISYWDDFYKQKIVWGNLSLSAQYSLAEEGLFINAPSPIIAPGDGYLLAILNSRLADWYIRSLGVSRNGGYFEYKPMFVEKLPVPNVDKKIQNEIEEKAFFIQKLKSMEQTTISLEKELDYVVFSLYGIDENERAFILDQK